MKYQSDDQYKIEQVNKDMKHASDSTDNDTKQQEDEHRPVNEFWREE